MQLQFATLKTDVLRGLLFSLFGLPFGAFFGTLCEFSFEGDALLSYVLLFAVSAIFTSMSEFVSNFIADAGAGLTFSVGAMLVVKNALVTPPLGFGIKIAITYYTAFILVSVIRKIRGTLPL